MEREGEERKIQVEDMEEEEDRRILRKWTKGRGEVNVEKKGEKTGMKRVRERERRCCRM